MVDKQYKQNPKIVITIEVKRELDKIKAVPEESYNGVIKRMIDYLKIIHKDSKNWSEGIGNLKEKIIRANKTRTPLSKIIS